MTHIAVACEPPFESRRIPPRLKQHLREQLTARAVFVATVVAFAYVGLVTTP